MKIPAFIAIACLWIAPMLAGQQSLRADVHDLDMRDETAIDSLLWIGELYNRPLGVVAGDKSITNTKISAQLSGATFENALNKIMTQLPNYEAHNLQGVLLVQPRNLVAATERLFAMAIPDFTAEGGATITELADLLWMDVELRVDPSIPGFAGVRHERDFTPMRPIHLVDVTVKTVLNELVRRHGSAAWVGFAAPELLNGIRRERLWSIVVYENPPMPIDKLCCLNRESLERVSKIPPQCNPEAG